MESNKLNQVMQEQSSQLLPDPMSTSEDIIQLVGFIVGTEEFSVPILSIQEIIKPITSTRVPHTPEYVLGVFNLRGSVIPLIDLRLKFGLVSREHTEGTRYIVMRHEDDIAGFVIDELTEVIRLNKKYIDPAPETIDKDTSIIDGVGKQNDKILTILKVDKLLQRSF